jgi:DNA-binding transcriptional regulator YdaS (Cro superfamily)
MAIRIQRNPQAVWRAIRAYGTQELMAADLAIEQQTVSAWGSGDRPVPWAFCVKIEAATRRIARDRRDPALVVTCEELQPEADWHQMLELAKLRMGVTT